MQPSAFESVCGIGFVLGRVRAEFRLCDLYKLSSFAGNWILLCSEKLQWGAILATDTLPPARAPEPSIDTFESELGLRVCRAVNADHFLG